MARGSAAVGLAMPHRQAAWTTPGFAQAAVVPNRSAGLSRFTLTPEPSNLTEGPATQPRTHSGSGDHHVLNLAIPGHQRGPVATGHNETNRLDGPWQVHCALMGALTARTWRRSSWTLLQGVTEADVNCDGGHGWAGH